MASIGFDHVGKVYAGEVRAITDVTFEVADGEFVVLVGPSGCGKSTLLRMVAGLEEITDGKITIGDRVVNDVPAKDRDIAMVFQNYALYPHMSVFDNMAFGLKLRKVPRDEIRRKVEETARILEITEFLDRRPRALSGGQRQRVAMGRAIVREPVAFLMDEPLSNLDAKLRVQMRAELTQLHQRLGTTTLYVTHDQIEAITMGNRVAVLRKGSLQQIDRPRELYLHPVNLFVAGFIGSPPMNFLRGIVGSQDGAPAVRIGETTLRLDPSVVASRPGLATFTGREIVVGIRPEAFEATARVPTGEARSQTLRVRIDVVEQLGAEAFVHFALDVPPVTTKDVRELLEDEAGEVALARATTQVTARVDPDLAPAAGATADLFVDTTKLHFFDPDSGLAIT